MSDARLDLQCVSFGDFEAIVRDASRSISGAMPGDQVRYLRSYLDHSDARAGTILVERPYVDRHWLEEYAGYYATMFQPPPPKATRLHFLRGEWSLKDFRDLLRRAAEGEAEQSARELLDHYLGYSVIRPLPSAPLGRTILRPYEGDPARCYAAAEVSNEVHLAGLTLSFPGLPFQQQDQGVGACATTAIWSALTSVMKRDGNRPATPLAITAAATDHRVQGRAFPAQEGLDLDQMATAMLSHGYQPHLFKPAHAPDDFILALKIYLRSGIPVVVRVLAGDETHALTFVGFREEAQTGLAEDIQVKLNDRIQLRSRGVVRWYVHDDRLGPYVRLDFLSDSSGNVEHDRLRLSPTKEGFASFEVEMRLWHALVPLYPKLRLTAEELIEFALDLRPPLEVLASSGDLYVEPRFQLGGKYLHDLRDRLDDPDRIVDIATHLLLSRYVGVLSWYLDDQWICDAVYDTTDVRRDSAAHPPLLGLFPSNPDWLKSLETMRDVRFGPRPLIG